MINIIVYVDLIILINFIFDFSLLLSVDLLLKRNASWIRVILGSLVGGLSIITMFIQFTRIPLFIFKILLSVFMSIATFNYRDFKYTLYNVIYLYLLGIVLGGFVTYLYNEFQINREYSIKYVILLVLSPLILIIYYKLMRKFKTNYNNRYTVLIDYENTHYEGVGFLDSGNKLVSPISGKPIILIEKEYITLHKLKLLPVPYNALNHHGILNCFKPEKVIINGVEIDNVLIGLSDVKFNIDGVSILLNARLEGI